MALTPEDVVNKRFNPTKFREGYDQDEVDDFLDEVVVELRRLNQENEELRQRLTASDARVSELQRSASQAPPPAPAVAEAPAPVVAPVAAPVPVPVPAPDYAAQDAAAIDQTNTNNLLQLARRLHEEHVREGMEKRDQLIAEGHATAARLVSDAETQQRVRIDALEVERAALETERQGLERQVEELRIFESEYRDKLKSYIEGQLRDLESAAPIASAEQPAAVAAPVSEAAPIEPAPIESSNSGAFELPVTETPTYEPPVYEPPVYEPPAYDAPSYEAPAYELPVVDADASSSVSEAPVYDLGQMPAPQSAVSSIPPAYTGFPPPQVTDYPAPTSENPEQDQPAYSQRTDIPGVGGN